MQATALHARKTLLPVNRNYLEKVKRQEDALQDKETPKLKKRLMSSVLLLLILMYFSMGHMMWGWPVGPEESVTAAGIGIIEMLLAAVIMYINRTFFTSGFKSIMHGAPNMDTLVAMGSGVSFLWSVYVLAGIITGSNGAVSASPHDPANMASLHNLYFESAAMIVTLITIGKMLEAMSKGRTTDALRSLMKLAPETAVVLRAAGEGQAASGDAAELVEVEVLRLGVARMVVVEAHRLGEEVILKFHLCHRGQCHGQCRRHHKGSA
jgi:Cu2+-exporting ATPase